MIAFAVVSLLVLMGLDGHGALAIVEGYNFNDTTVKPSTLPCAGVWSIPVEKNGSVGCKCGDDLSGLVLCDESTLKVQLHLCYCMTFYAKDSNITVVGPCLHKCHYSHSFYHIVHYNSIPDDVSELSNYTCSIKTPHSSSVQSLNRDGQLCGKCKEGFAPPAYSYDWHCVSCSLHDTSWKRNWAKYFAIAYLPLTVCFIVIVVFHINTTSPSLKAFVFISQISASPMLVKAYTSYLDQWSVSDLYEVKTLVSLYGFWNLDFFRMFYPLFCLHPNMSSLQVLALDYGIAVYPLLLIVVTYTLVELHDHNCRIVVSLWKPFHRCFVCFRRQWNIRTSLINAFVSFLQLSYVKLLIVSFYFLTPVHLYTVSGQPVKESYLLFDATIEYFGQHHLPYAILATVILSVFNIFPMLLLCFYPCLWFQKFLNCCRLSHHALHTFMDAFQGCYRNRTDGTRDCRWFSAVYFMAQILIFFIALIVPTIQIFALFTGMLLLLPLILTAVVQPYKSSLYNSIDVVLLVIFVLFFFSVVGGLQIREGSMFVRMASNLINPMLFICAIAPLVYIFMVVLYYLFLRHQLSQQCFSKLWSSLQCQKLSSRWKYSEEPLPERLSNPEECAALLQEPLNHDQGTYGSMNT